MYNKLRNDLLIVEALYYRHVLFNDFDESAISLNFEFISLLNFSLKEMHVWNIIDL